MLTLLQSVFVAPLPCTLVRILTSASAADGEWDGLHYTDNSRTSSDDFSDHEVIEYVSMPRAQEMLTLVRGIGGKTWSTDCQAGAGRAGAAPGRSAGLP